MSHVDHIYNTFIVPFVFFFNIDSLWTIYQKSFFSFPQKNERRPWLSWNIFLSIRLQNRIILYLYNTFGEGFCDDFQELWSILSGHDVETFNHRPRHEPHHASDGFQRQQHQHWQPVKAIVHCGTRKGSETDPHRKCHWRTPNFLLIVECWQYEVLYALSTVWTPLSPLPASEPRWC